MASELAREIVTRIVTNAIRGAWIRTLNDALADRVDADDSPTEQELIDDALALALGDDIGCADEDDEDFRENIELYWLEDKLVALESELARLRWSEISESTTFTADKHYLLARRVGADGRVDYSTLDGSDYQRPGVGYHLSHECAYFAFQEINAPAPPSTEPADREAL